MLTDDGSLSAIHTPGHTPGSVTVRLTTDQTDIWFTGDTSFTADGMDCGADGRHPHGHAAGAGIAIPLARRWADPALPRPHGARSARFRIRRSVAMTIARCRGCGAFVSAPTHGAAHLLRH